MYHLKLKKGISYSGVVSATKSKPDVFVEDVATANSAVATGYFELVGVETYIDNNSNNPAGGAPEGGNGNEVIDDSVEDYSKMTKPQLEKKAEELEIDISNCKKNDERVEAIIAAIAARDAQLEIDFNDKSDNPAGGAPEGGSPTMTKLQS